MLDLTTYIMINTMEYAHTVKCQYLQWTTHTSRATKYSAYPITYTAYLIILMAGILYGKNVLMLIADKLRPGHPWDQLKYVPS